ncbi:alpha/beta hydrolase [Acidovorax sp.]|uniref:alpha/beta hydrolase n=1 Tax=Acidovorax sp. TaxID=1872122 RepID=UPI0026182401|nr:alpha/beta hydrolase [Acidovorax sp.]
MLHAVAHRFVTAAPSLKASPVLAFFMGARRWAGRVALAAAVGVGLAGCAVTTESESSTTPTAPTSAFQPIALPGEGGASLWALQRSERVAPLRYRVIVVPGSGCAGLGPFADRYFAGLLHAQVLVLHKPGVDPEARTAPADCARSFVQQDRHSTWLAHARAALRADAQQRQGQPALPQWLVGISEGAELLPALAPEVPHLAGLVLLSASGLDPQEAGALQARRLGVEGDWAALAQMVAGTRPDSTVVQGRSLGYWRDLWNWPVAKPLINGPWPLLQVWGGNDALVPAAAYARFAERASVRTAPFCVRRLDGADHGLQRRVAGGEGVDGVQQVWAWTEQWARYPAHPPAAGLCGPLLP